MPLKVPRNLLQTEALNRRMPSTHPKKEIANISAKNMRAGYNGELGLEYPLSFLPHDDNLIFYHLRIPDNNGYFQMDALILTSKFILIIEAKNIYGTISFDDMGQAIRSTDEKVDIFTNPIEQVNLQHLRLLQWLREGGFSKMPIPIEKIVAYSGTSTILRNLVNDKTISDTVMRTERILTKITEIERKYQTVCLSEEQLKNLSSQLVSAHSPEDENVLGKYNVSYEELIKGVFCPECNAVPMQWRAGKWVCSYCNTVSKIAHRNALEDYALLISERVSNQQARDFLQMKSDNMVKGLLKNENFDQIGKNKGRKYLIGNNN
ncbi:NERD domain-containing protein [Oceanobacillus chungangensis]|nr:NERD domain-containing protein [Oceanobacillus chungangensis]